MAVDIRPGSPSFGRWVGAELSADNKLQMWIPEGFAHGFIALQDGTEFLYKITDVYAPQCERAIAWNDPAIGIEWPLPAGISAPTLAAKDAAAPDLGQVIATGLGPLMWQAMPSNQEACHGRTA